MSAQLDNLTREVQETRSVMASAATLIAGLADQIREGADDPAAMTVLADELDAAQATLAAAITANTPAQP
jgi:hypothetical protein